jgi:hypothetical protein
MDSGLRPLPEPVRGQVAERLSTLALLVRAGVPVAWSEEHDDEARMAVRLEVDGGHFCALCAEQEPR